MLYTDTRDSSARVSFKTAVLNGMNENTGGLYIPIEIPKLDIELILIIFEGFKPLESSIALNTLTSNCRFKFSCEINSIGPATTYPAALISVVILCWELIYSIAGWIVSGLDKSI